MVRRINCCLEYIFGNFVDDETEELSRCMALVEFVLWCRTVEEITGGGDRVAKRDDGIEGM